VVELSIGGRIATVVASIAIGYILKRVFEKRGKRKDAISK
jgi:hypothetical protein